MTNDSVMIGYIHPAMVHSDFMHSLLGTIFYDMGHERHLNNPGGWANLHCGVNVAIGRNELVRRFLTGNADWMLMIDSDIIFPPMLVSLMVKHAHELNATVLSGLYWGMRNNPDGPGAITFPVVYLSVTDIPDEMGPLKMLPGEPIPVDGVGAGCLLVHRSALEAVRDADYGEVFPFFQETVRSGHIMSEDLEFCMRLREVGHQVWFDPRIEVGHMKDIPLIRELTGKALITMETFNAEVEYVPAVTPIQNGLPPKAKKKAKKR